MEQSKTPDSDSKGQKSSHGRGGVRGKGRGWGRGQGQDQWTNQKKNTTRYNSKATKFQGKSTKLEFVCITLTTNGPTRQAKEIKDASMAYKTV